MLIDFQKVFDHLTAACNHYEKSAPTVAAYCDDLYRRMGGDWKSVTLAEIVAVSALLENGEWEHPNYAANRIYKLMDSIGMPTTGHAGF